MFSRETLAADAGLAGVGRDRLPQRLREGGSRGKPAVSSVMKSGILGARLGLGPEGLAAQLAAAGQVRGGAERE